MDFFISSISFYNESKQFTQNLSKKHVDITKQTV